MFSTHESFTMAITIRREDLASVTARDLIGVLNAELAAMYSEPGANHFGLEAAEVAPGRGAFLVAWRDETPVGCGAVRLLDPSIAELKRMYVDPTRRGLVLTGPRLMRWMGRISRRRPDQAFPCRDSGSDSVLLRLVDGGWTLVGRVGPRSCQ